MKQSFVQFKKPIITNLFYALKDDFNAESIGQKQTEVETDVRVEWDENAPIASVSLSLNFTGECFPFLMQISMLTVVEWAEVGDVKTAEAILNNNIPALLLSYIRPIISQLTSNSPYGSFDVPFFDFTDNAESDDLEDV